MINKIVWGIKQIFPLTYRTTYTDSEGSRHFTVWNMWFGRCFNIDDFIIESV